MGLLRLLVKAELSKERHRRKMALEEEGRAGTQMVLKATFKSLVFTLMRMMRF